MADETENWVHQDRGKLAFYAARCRGARRILAVAPPGAGKTRVMVQLSIEEVEAGGSVRLYVHRRMLFTQFINVFRKQGVDVGVQADGHTPDFEKSIQVCMLDTVYARAVSRQKWTLGSPSLVIIDEAHLQTSGKAIAVLIGWNKDGIQGEGHWSRGACVIGFTATPVDCTPLYQEMIELGSYYEMRQVKAHLPIEVYSPSEIDCSGLKASRDMEFSSDKLFERSTAIVGDAYTGWKKLNPHAYPALLFAPSVEGSRWFADQWCKHGVPAAHLDGEVALIPERTATGSLELVQYDSNADGIRDTILKLSETGQIKLLCNRFVLREGLDLPWIYHGIGATVFGGIATYLQSVGRIQRFHPAYDHKIWQDHGGSYWKHGSPNDNREWNLGDTNRSIAIARVKDIGKAERPQDIEGICCPKCNGWRNGGKQCYHCGHMHERSSRAVRMLSGELEIQKGLVNKLARKKHKNANVNSIWMSVLYGSAISDRSVSSAVALWVQRCRDKDVVPNSADLIYRQPGRESADWHRKVRNVYPEIASKVNRKGQHA